jgi:hypothetical protein
MYLEVLKTIAHEIAPASIKWAKKTGAFSHVDPAPNQPSERSNQRVIRHPILANTGMAQ